METSGSDRSESAVADDSVGWIQIELGQQTTSTLKHVKYM